MRVQVRERVVAYDCREMWINPKEYVDDSYRKTFLLDESVNKPLSIDTMIWASIFDGKIGNVTWESPSLPDHMDVWENKSEMEKALENFRSLNFNRIWEIAITILDEGEALPCWEILNDEPTFPENGWTFLGYDVADDGFISGLMNCGYGPEESKTEVANLNEHHLFCSPDDAISFRKYSNTRVEEHAPFRVFGIYKIAEMGDV